MTSAIENKTYDELQLGDNASLTRTLTVKDIQLFAIATGDLNPAHVDEAFARTDMFHHIIGHGMWTGSLFSAVLGMKLPGPGTVYLSQSLRFLKPVYPGDTVTATVTVTALDDAKKRVTLTTMCENQKGERVAEGEAVVLAPAEKIRWTPPALSELNPCA